MDSRSTLRAVLLTVVSVLLGVGIALAQDCTANAGGNVTICGSLPTLTGGISGAVGAGSPSRAFVSDPVTPTIASPSPLTTNVTGMNVSGDYVFRFSRPYNTNTAQSLEMVTAHPWRANFIAGPDITNICATAGTATLAGVIPAGHTGSWSAVNIFNKLKYSYTDQEPFNSTNHYHLKQTDMDGQYIYSAIKQVSFGNNNTTSI